MPFFSTRLSRARKSYSEMWPILYRLGWIWAVIIRDVRTCANLMVAIPCLRKKKNIGIKPSRTIQSPRSGHRQVSRPRKQALLMRACRLQKTKVLAQFPYRILVVDDELSIRETAVEVLESQGYEVLTAGDGVDGLHALGKSLPDLIISDLSMPRMSGFEFLAVVRKRFPHIATIAVSGEYITAADPPEILADTFLQKGHYTLKELFHEIAELLYASPIRPEEGKSVVAPLFVPRDDAGYLIVTCTKCLRPNRLEASTLNGGIHQTTCISCRTPMRFEIDHETEPLMKRNDA